METNKKSIRYLLPCLAIVCAILYTYWALPQTYFQQDEWIGFGHRVYDLSLPEFSFLRQFSTSGLFSQFGPLSSVFCFMQVLFWLDFAPYAYLSIFFHIINSLLVYFLVTRLTKERMVGFLTGLLFGTWYIAHQTVTWIGTSFGVEAATLFLVLSLLFFLKYRDEKNRRKYYYLSLGMLLISVGFKEVGAPCFIFLPVWGFISMKKERGWRFSWLKEQAALIICALFYLGLRALPSLIKAGRHLVIGDKPWNYLPVTVYNLVMMFLYRAVTLPFKTVSQAFFPQRFIISIAERIVGFAYPFIEKQKGTTSYDIITQTIVSDIVSYFIAFAIFSIVIIFIFYLYRQQKLKEVKATLFFLLLTVISSMPFIFITDLWGYFTFLESRYLYVPVIGAAGLFVIIISEMVDLLGKRIKALNSIKIRSMVAFIVVAPVLMINVHTIRNKVLKNAVEQGQQRKLIIHEIKTKYPTIGKKSVFFIRSNKSYYAMGRPMLPFQSGFGYTLMVIYREFLDPRLFKNTLFYRDFFAQGYFTEGESGFGYFIDYRELERLINSRETGLSASNVYAFRWDGHKNELIDDTERIRLRLISENGRDFIKSILKRNLNIESDEENWVYFDNFYGLDVQKHFLSNARIINEFEDEFYTAKTFTHVGWIGAMLVYNVAGNGTGIYRIPSELYGYEVVHISEIYLDSEVPLLPKRHGQDSDGTWMVEFPVKLGEINTIQFRLMLAVHQLDLEPDLSEVTRITKTEILSTIADGYKKSFAFKLPAKISAVATLQREKVVAYIDGIAAFPERISGVHTNELAIMFENPPGRGQRITIPVLIDYEPQLK